MNTESISYSNIDETMHVYNHASGLKAYVIPKKGYSKSYATFGTHYGSINSEFIVPGEKEPFKVPDGIAHFLEHKLFEQKDGSVMDKFTALGASPNAYTSFNQTVFLFSCTEKFNECFQLLLNFVQNPYLTDESVEKEKDIISQEIRMYEDDPGWRAFFNLVRAFYTKNPIRLDIAGTIDSIREINREILLKCYRTFYHPSNMVVIVVGDVDYRKVFEQVENSIVAVSKPEDIMRIFPEENAGLNTSYTEQKLAVSVPLFQMGFRDNRTGLTGKDTLRQEVGTKLVLEMIMGKSSPLYTQLYNEGLINATFAFDYTLEENYAFSIFGGESPDPGKVREIISGAIEGIRKTGLDSRTFERIRKSSAGKFIRQWNSVERISYNFSNVYFKGANVFDYFDVYDKITFEYANEIFASHFNLENLALSVIKPS
jgi:predicted Zn-dependent peptidase